MNNNVDRPKEYDAVLGGSVPPPVAGVVLGGIEGVKSRLGSRVVETRIAAVSEALKYGEAGLDLIIEALKDNSLQVQNAAARLLRSSGNSKAKQVLLDRDPWLFFTRWENWKLEYFEPHIGISDPVGTAYRVELKKFRSLLQDPQAKKLEALKCEIQDNPWNRRNGFEYFVSALVEAYQQLPNLKALFIGDSQPCTHKDSEIKLYNISPLLKRYPNLEILQVRGCIGKVDIPLLKAHCKEEVVQVRSRIDGSEIKINPLKHARLKTLIIETADLTDRNLAQICNLECPSLEYLELWLGRRDSENAGIGNLDSLTPVLLGKLFPNLAYLGLINSEITCAIARDVVKSPIVNRLKVLNLSIGTLSNAGALALLESPAVDRLHTLNVSENCLNTNMIERLSQLNCRVIAESQFLDRYYSVWE